MGHQTFLTASRLRKEIKYQLSTLSHPNKDVKDLKETKKKYEMFFNHVWWVAKLLTLRITCLACLVAGLFLLTNSLSDASLCPARLQKSIM